MLTLRELPELLSRLNESLDNEPSLSGVGREFISIGLTEVGLMVTLGGVIVFIEKHYFDASKSKDMTARLQEIAPGYFVCQGLSTKSTSDQLSLLDGMIANEPQDTSRK
jgi:hypothetical protein